MNCSWVLNKQGEGRWLEAYPKLIIGRGMLGHVKISKNLRKYNIMEAK